LKTSKLKQKPQFIINETNEDVFSGLVGRPVISLGHQVGQKVFWEGHKFFKLYPILSNYVQHIFQGAIPHLRPPGYGPACWSMRGITENISEIMLRRSKNDPARRLHTNEVEREISPYFIRAN